MVCNEGENVFGYIRVSMDELRIKDWKYYRSIYCALCKQLSEFSQSYRLLLSYDMVFLTLLASCDIDEDIIHNCGIASSNCHGGPYCFGKCHGDDKIRFISAFSIALQYHKIRDDIIDGDKKKKLIIPLFKGGYRKCITQYKQISEIVENNMNSLLELESSNSTDIKELENQFASIFKEVFMFLPDTDIETREVLSIIAYHISAWVYVCDMFDDQEKDSRKNNFNPLLNSDIYGNEYEKKQYVNLLLVSHIEEIRKCLAILPYNQGTPIIENIVNFGLPEQMRLIGLLN